ncbi:MAG: carbamoyltransferase HypF [Candidatus Thorarchaeota archaeon]|nr:MAG: carbamoyltransferase HypF [Candidatus Thorarchaeota archaeon]
MNSPLLEGAKVVKKRAVIHVTGIVQGVGFRPFVYRVARFLSLIGYVLNLGDAGVEIVVEGTEKQIQELINSIKNDLPSISRIDTLDIEWAPAENTFSDFLIHKSSIIRNDDAIPVLPPDIAICNDCVADLFDVTSHWHQYGFTSCAACGPRYSTITDLPYDRPNTTMIDFPLCDTCNTSYTNPLDRRYHAQTTACDACGPRYRLVDRDAQIFTDSNPIESIAKLIDDGAIAALQGIAGTHIATKTSDAKPIKVLRDRKKRFQRPFALMVRNLDVLKKLVDINKLEERILTSWRRPIVLASRKSDSGVLPLIQESVLDVIAPGLNSIGVMLPYAPMHHLLFKYSKEPALVMTSANPTGMPMYIDPEVIIRELGDIADYFLLHDRRIHQRADDSVVKLTSQENPVFIRRARGYVPEPLIFNGPWKSLKVLGVGPEEKATGALAKSGRVYLTQYIGDTNQVENIEFLEQAIDHMKHLLDISKLDGVACDLHPEFLSTELANRIALENDIPLFRVQHHHAHLSSLIVDGLIPIDNRIVCITADGYGYGEDGTAWGGEVLVGGFEDYERVGGLIAQDYTGGDLSAVYSARAFLGIVGNELENEKILQILGPAEVSPSQNITSDMLDILVKVSKSRINTIKSSSTGRVLDSVAVALGICSQNSYDGECPMKLEAVARRSDIQLEMEFIKSNYGRVLDTTHLLLQIVELRKKGISRPELAYAAQQSIGHGLAEIACEVAHDEQILHVGFSGGVAVNQIITKSITNHIQKNNLVPIIHSLVPPGDGGISVGQVATAAAKLIEE